MAKWVFTKHALGDCIKLYAWQDNQVLGHEAECNILNVHLAKAAPYLLIHTHMFNRLRVPNFRPINASYVTI